MDIKAALQVDQSLDEVLIDSEDAKEGISAFLEKRKPVWKVKVCCKTSRSLHLILNNPAFRVRPETGVIF